MARLASTKNRWALGWCLAILMLAGSIPLSAGFAITATPSHAELSIDLCHPIQVAETARAFVLALPTVDAVQVVLCDLGPLPKATCPKFESLPFPPESPPPEATI